MLSWLIRIALLVGALACLLDAALPTAAHQAQVVGHSRTITTSSENGGPAHTATNYDLGLVAGPVKSCSVDSAAYGILHDGNNVTVTTTRVFKSCVAVEYEGEGIYRQNWWRFIRMLIAMVLLGFFVATLFSQNSGPSQGNDFNDGPSYSRSYTIVDSDSSGTSSDSD